MTRLCGVKAAAPPVKTGKSTRLFTALAIILAAGLCAGCGAVSKESRPEDLSFPPVYDTSDAVAASLVRMEKERGQADLYTDIPTMQKVVFLSLDGIVDIETTEKLMDLLERYNAEASFFLPGIKSAENPEVVRLIARHGYEIGSYTLTAARQMDSLATVELVEDFTSSSVILSQITEAAPPQMLKCRSTVYTPELLLAAKASGVNYAVDSRNNLSYQSLKSPEEAGQFVLGLELGAILSVKLDSVLDEMEYGKNARKIDMFGSSSATEPQEEQEASSSAADSTVAPAKEVKTTEDSREERLLTVVEYLLAALDRADYQVRPVSDIPEYEDEIFKASYTELREQNDGEFANVFTNARTTRRAVGLYFCNIQNERRLDSALSALRRAGITATFFVSGVDIETRPELVAKIVNDGHQLENGGMSGRDMSAMSFGQISFEISQCDNLLKERYGVESKLFSPPFGKITDAVMEAVSAQGYAISGYNKYPVVNGVLSAEGISQYFRLGFNMGDIVYCPLDKSDEWEGIIPEIVKVTGQTDYGFMTLRELYDSQYPLKPLHEIPGWNAIRENKNFDINASQLDRIVTEIDVDEKVLFLTFDDWGSDKTINDMLDFLESYDIKASFFVRANGVELNPNLARAMAEQGHDVLSHSYAHNRIIDMDVEPLQADAVKAHHIITQTIGFASPLLYRAPTLAHENEQINALYASGYRYIVSSVLSTHDYERTAGEVAEQVLDEAVPGSLILMHISDNACATEAMKIFIPQLLEQGYSFARVSDYLH